MLNPTGIEISPAELAASLEAGDDIQVLDVRAAHRLAAGTVEAARFLNIRGSEIMGMADPSAAGLDPDRPIAVVCGHGNASLQVARHLASHGFRALSLHGGVTAWMDLVRPRELPAPSGFDRLIQFDRVGKGSLGYLIVSGDEALAVDPSRDWQVWARAAEEAGARLVGLADTHVHADFISGGPAAAAALGVPYYLHPDDSSYPYDGTPGEIAFEPIVDGSTISVGSGEVRVVHTPGHTLGSVCFGLGDDAVLTGDFLFVNSIGRPDLAGKTEEWTGLLWDSLGRARASLPAGAMVYPAHYASDRERNADRSVGRSFGELSTENPALQIESEADFRAFVGMGVSAPPEAYKLIKAINVGLARVDPAEAQVLEAGKNECALG